MDMGNVYKYTKTKGGFTMSILANQDEQVFNAIQLELGRQRSQN